MDPVLNDKRFAHVGTDVRFRSVPKKETKVRIDRRFRSMFTGENFEVKYSVDKRGRPNKHSARENLRKYYDLTSESDAEDSVEEEDDLREEAESETSVKKVRAKSEITEDVDWARGRGGAAETSSSEEESSASDDDDEEDEQDGLIHPWGELDADARRTNDNNGGAAAAAPPVVATRRLAVCNMDWDRVAAQDLYVLLNSFTPPGGVLRSVKVYLSDYGRERLRDEEVRGPRELVSEKPLAIEEQEVGQEQEQEVDEEQEEEEEDGGEEGREGDKYRMEKLRQYQLNRLKYYYAVAECDCARTAAKIYEECDGLEYESSAARVDLRYVPEDMLFEQEAESAADGSAVAGGYHPKTFTTTALQQAKVQLTWDETNPDRMRVIQRAFDQKQEEDMDLGAYLAASSDSEEEDRQDAAKMRKDAKDARDGAEDEEDGEDESAGILKYKALLKDIEDSENKRNNDNEDVHLEITWGTGLKEKAESMIKNKMANEDATPWQKYLNRKKEKKNQKREERKRKNGQRNNRDDVGAAEYSDDDVPSDVDLDDPFFERNVGEEPDVNFGSKKNKKKLGKQKMKEEEEEDEDVKQKNAELELLLMQGGVDPRHHYNLNKLIKSNSKNKTKNKTKQKNEEEKDNFQMSVDDPRFSAIFTEAEFNIDPSEPSFRRTAGAEALVREKQKRRAEAHRTRAAKRTRRHGQEDNHNRGQEDNRNRQEDQGNPRDAGPIQVSAKRPAVAARDARLTALMRSVKSKAANLNRKNNNKPTAAAPR